MDFSVIRKEGEVVKPYEKTPTEILELSVIDRLAVLRCNARTLHVFKNGPEAARVIREASSKALVAYYPLAGRLKDSHSHLQIDCCGEGVWFVEAYANCTLHSLNYLDNLESIPYHHLLPQYAPQNEDTAEPLVQMQVTQFGCGGFVIGLIFCHAVCDGLGAAQFLNAVGQLARGVSQLDISPVWCRDFSPPPPHPPNSTPQPHPIGPPPIPNYKLEHTNIDIPMDQIAHLKEQFKESTAQTCSTFEVIAATFWKQRTIAINLEHNIQVKLVFFANGRQVVDPPLPKGFYGNCFFPVTITALAETLAQASNIEVIKLIQEAKAKLPIEFEKYLKGENLKEGGDPFAPPLVYSTLFISEWGRLGFNQVDYGWGAPVHVVPIQGSAIIPVGILGCLPLPKKGVRLMTWCVEQLHRPQFLQHMTEAVSFNQFNGPPDVIK